MAHIYIQINFILFISVVFFTNNTAAEPIKNSNFHFEQYFTNYPESIFMIPCIEEAPIPEPTCGKGYSKSNSWIKDSVFYEGKCKNGVLHGKWKVVNSAGKIRQNGQFEQGKKTGTWYTYHYYHDHESGKYILENYEVKNYRNDTLDGEYFIFNNQSKNKTTTGTYKNGEKIGKWIYKENYYFGYDFTEEYTLSDTCEGINFTRISENEIITGTINKNQMIGKWLTKDSMGNLLFSIFYEPCDTLFSSKYYWQVFPFSGSIEGKVTQSHFNSKSGIYIYNIYQYKNNKLHGPFQELNINHSEFNDYYKTGIPTMNYGNYVYGVKNGKFFSLKGQDTLSIGNYNNGLLHGFWREYQYGRILYEAHFNLGIKEGPYSKYIYNGTKLESIETFTYKDSLYNGLYSLKNNKGILLEEGNYLNNLKHGDFNYFDEYGTKYKSITFKNGIPLKTTEYSSDNSEIFIINLQPEIIHPEIDKVFFLKNTQLPNDKSWYRLHQKILPQKKEILWVLFYEDTTFSFKTDLQYKEIK